MKKVIFILALFVSVFANAQTTINIYCGGDTQQVVVPPDTVFIHDTIYANCDSVNNDTIVTEPIDTTQIDSLSGYIFFLVTGQSNADGYAPLTHDDSTSKALLWNGTTLVPAIGWLNKYSNIYSGWTMNGGKSFANSFSRVAGDSIPQKVVFVVNCRPNTGIASFVYGGYLSSSITRLEQAMAANPNTNNKIGGVLYHQGEWDAEHGTESCYKANFNYLRMMVDQRIGDTIPIFVGGLYTGNSVFNTMNNILPQVEINTYKWVCPDVNCTSTCPTGYSSLPYYHDNYYVSSQGLVTTGDYYHFNSNSADIFGKRYWHRYLDSVH